MVLLWIYSRGRPGAKAVAMVGNVKRRFGMENQHVVSERRGNLPACAGKKFGVFQDLQVIIPAYPENGFGTGNKVILNLVHHTILPSIECIGVFGSTEEGTGT